jgi:anti-sigma factor RsiW
MSPSDRSSTACDAARRDLADALRGRLSVEAQRSFDEHLSGCAACRGLERRERELDAALARLPEQRAPSGLEARLRASLGAAAPVTSAPVMSAPVTSAAVASAAVAAARQERSVRAHWARNSAAIAAAFALAASVVLFVARGERGSDALVAEAVNDHLRVLYSAHAVEIESGGIHQVKPWFEGRLDFAPRLDFEGDADFNLTGGSVGYFIDRKAAVFVFKHRLHLITLFEFRADGLPWPSASNLALGHVQALQTRVRGFQVLAFRDGDLGYALVSDVEAGTLVQLGTRVAAGL